MRHWTPRGLGTLIVVFGLAGLFGGAGADGSEVARPGTVRVGLVGTLFQDTPAGLIEPMMRPFKSLMESQTGVTGQMVVAQDADELCKQFEEERIHFGVFHGFEFAWARQKLPKLKPLVIAVNQYRHLKAYLVVHRDSEVGSLADLRGKAVALPKFSRGHCRLFLERRCQECGESPAEFFAELTRPQDAEAALDQVADGTIQAAVVDQLALDSYQRMKPGWFPYLKVVQESELFPATVVSYQDGTLDEATLRRFRDGLIRANQTRTGKQILGMCRITAFERVPDDYEKMLAEILKSYPPPDAPAK